MSDRVASGSDGTVSVVSVPDGAFVFRAGEAADSFFIISTGQIELLRGGQTHGRLALLGPHDLCGEDSAFEGHVRAYDARAVTSSTLLRVPAATFLDLVRVRPELAGLVIGWTATRLLRARTASLTMALPIGTEPGRAERATAAPRLVHIESGLQFLLPDRSDVMVGRADPGTKAHPDVELSSVDVHRSLSRSHAAIVRAANGFQVVEQPRVANGTFVNGARLSAGVPAPIKEGDEVTFGLITTVFRTT